MSVDLARVRLRYIAAVSAATLALAGAGCAGLQSGAPVLIQPPGSAGVQSTDHGVVWSVQQADGAPAILRSSDAGQSWRIALAGRLGATLVASFFLGPSYAWVVHEQRSRAGEVLTVAGTSDAGQTWWRGSPLPRDAMSKLLAPHVQLYFADPMHGWLLTSAFSAPPSTRRARGRVEVQRLWRTTDGGHVWILLPARALPLPGRALPLHGHAKPPHGQATQLHGQATPLHGQATPLHGQARPRATAGCAGQPAVAFANANAGWLTEGGCGIGRAGPVVWRTRTSGRHWVPFPLATPDGGWGSAAGSQSGGGGLEVGPARVINSRVSAIVLVPVADGPSRIVIEKSTDGGQTWTVAAQVGTSLAAGSPTGCFDPLNVRQWVLCAPGELIETADAGQMWTYQSSAVILPGAQVSFTSLSHGFLQVADLVSAMATANGGQTWTSVPAPR